MSVLTNELYVAKHRENRPRIGITIGDPAGIGPEIVLKAVVSGGLETADIVLIGSERTLKVEAENLDMSWPQLLADKSFSVADPGDIDFDVTPGLESSEGGLASARCIEIAVSMWRAGDIDAIATAPISKNALKLAGYKYPGHTEFLAHLTDTQRFAMSFFADNLRVVLLSTHCSLVDAISLVKREALVELIKFSSEQFESLLGRQVSLAVAGLNPHASEGGMFGSEEATEIVPAIDVCRRELGINVTGPFAPDTIFLRGFRGEFDAVIACYHDQATIAVKSLSFGSAVNVTLGLPLVRTSVDHGTAFDIAGKGIADASSMTTAVRLAVELTADSVKS